MIGKGLAEAFNRRRVAFACEGCRRVVTETRLVTFEEAEVWIEQVHNHGAGEALVVCCGVCCVKTTAIARRRQLEVDVERIARGASLEGEIERLRRGVG